MATDGKSEARADIIMPRRPAREGLADGESEGESETLEMIAVDGAADG